MTRKFYEAYVFSFVVLSFYRHDPNIRNLCAYAANKWSAEDMQFKNRWMRRQTTECAFIANVIAIEFVCTACVPLAFGRMTASSSSSRIYACTANSPHGCLLKGYYSPARGGRAMKSRAIVCAEPLLVLHLYGLVGRRHAWLGRRSRTQCRKMHSAPTKTEERERQ